MVVTIGVAIASYGEINFVVIGVILQLVSIVAEALRLSLVQARDYAHRTVAIEAVSGCNAVATSVVHWSAVVCPEKSHMLPE